MSEQIKNVGIDAELTALENEYDALAEEYKERYFPTWVMRAMVLMQKQKQQCDELATALQIAMDIMATEIDEFEFPSSFETIRAALAKYRQPNETLEKIASGDMDGSEIFELSKVEQHRDLLLEALGGKQRPT